MAGVGHVEMSKADSFGRSLKTGNRIAHFALWNVGQFLGSGGNTVIRRRKQLIGIADSASGGL